MLGKIFSLFASVTVLAGCTNNTPDIRAICLRDDIGNYVIKWETDPQIEGSVRISVSDKPDAFENLSPVVYANANDGVATYITNDNITRKYFRITFDERYSQVIGARSVAMDSVQNVRDMGGYLTKSGKTTRWGKIFRSGQLANLSEVDSIRLDNLGIKTIIDLRTEKEVMTSPTRYPKANTINIPISTGNMAELPSRIQAGTMRKGDAQLFMQDEYLQFITHNTGQFAKVMELFLNADNYPILINCSYGKDRVGFLSAMLLAILGVDHDLIIKDYLTSNEYINLKPLAYLAKDLSSDAQESITVLLAAHEALMDLTVNHIEKEYGSVDKYLSKGLRITEKKREKIKDILLY